MDLNLNADLGESYGAWTMGDDAALLPLVDSASIACGFHAGDPLVMRRTLRDALAAGCSIGAHPAYPDLQGFGRRPMHLPADELEAALLYQLSALAGMARCAGGRMSHVKPHGALSNQACADALLAETVVRAIRDFDANLILLAPALSELAAAGMRSGLAVALEVFADRAYTTSGQLAPRSQTGAVLHEPAECVAHVLRMIDGGGLATCAGTILPTPFHSICVHGDGARAIATARTLRDTLLGAGHRLRPLTELAPRR